MTVLERIVLASASPRRLELLRSLGFAVTVAPSGYHEPPMPHLTPLELAISHARAKLASVSRVDGAATVAADTVVDLDGDALGKPRDPAEAIRMLQMLSGREHLVHTAYAVALPGIETPLEDDETTRVRFHFLTPDVIEEYVASGEPMDKAGAYGIQGRASALVAGIDGDFYTVMGFPLGGFVRSLRRSGFVPPAANRPAR